MLNLCHKLPIILIALAICPSVIPVVYAGEPAVSSCILGRKENGLTGTYHTNGRVAFDSRPAKEWEFMATGTGVTGLTVNFPKEMVMQINHSAAIDELGKLRALGRVHLDLAGSPFANSSSFNMEHDLRRSVIKACAETDSGPVKVEIRAHVPMDAVRIDIYDEREAPGDVSIWFKEDAPSEKLFIAGNRVMLRHENPSTGEGIKDGNRHWLAGRTFGMCVRSMTDRGIQWSDGRLTIPASRHHILYIVGISRLGGARAFDKSITERMNRVVATNSDEFVRTHEAWWRQFWARSYFEPDDPKGRMVRYRAAFDLFRYYTACCTSDRRETPARFQIDLVAETQASGVHNIERPADIPVLPQPCVVRFPGRHVALPITEHQLGRPYREQLTLLAVQYVGYLRLGPGKHVGSAPAHVFGGHKQITRQYLRLHLASAVIPFHPPTGNLRRGG